MKLFLLALVLAATSALAAVGGTVDPVFRKVLDESPRDVLSNPGKTASRETVNAVDNMVFQAPTAPQTAAFPTAARPTVGIDKIVSSPQQMGAGWASNRVVVWVDPLSSPTVMTNGDQPADWLKIAREQIGKGGREASAFVRLFHGTNLVHVHITRFRSKDDITPNWGTDNATWTKQTCSRTWALESGFRCVAPKPR